jgi:hypothetical protein
MYTDISKQSQCHYVLHDIINMNTSSLLLDIAGACVLGEIWFEESQQTTSSDREPTLLSQDCAAEQGWAGLGWEHGRVRECRCQ